MARVCRKRSKKASPKSSGFLDKADVLADRVHVELPVSLAEIIAGVRMTLSGSAAKPAC